MIIFLKFVEIIFNMSSNFISLSVFISESFFKLSSIFFSLEFSFVFKIVAGPISELIFKSFTFFPFSM